MGRSNASAAPELAHPTGRGGKLARSDLVSFRTLVGNAILTERLLGNTVFDHHDELQRIDTINRSHLRSRAEQRSIKEGTRHAGSS